MDALTSISPATLALVPLVVGLVQIAKGAGLPVQYTPVLSLVAGVVLSILIPQTLQEVVINGLVVGLSASGLYSGVKATARGV